LIGKGVAGLGDDNGLPIEERVKLALTTGIDNKPAAAQHEEEVTVSENSK